MIKHVNVDVKIILIQKNYSWIPRSCFCEYTKYLKSIAYTSVINCDEVKHVLNFLLTKMAVSTSSTGTFSTNCHSKKVRYKIDR